MASEKPVGCKDATSSPSLFKTLPGVRHAMRSERLALAMLGILLLAGCTLPPAPATPTATPAPQPPSASSPALEVYTPAGLAIVPLAVDLEPRWVRPGEAMNATAAPALARVDWFAINRNPIRRDTLPAMSERIQPGASATFVLRDAGRHVFDVDGAPLAVAVVPGEARANEIVVVTAEGAGWNVTPHVVRGGPGTQILVENRGAIDVLVQRRDVDAHLGSGARASLLMPDDAELGDYSVIALATDDGRVGENATRIVYDRRKPDEVWSFGPLTGRFDAAARAEPMRHELTFALPSTGGRVEIAATSGAPLPFAVRASLRDAAGDEIAGGSAPGFDMPPFGAGPAALVVEATDGILVEYSASLSGRYVLEPPESFFNT